MNRLRGAAVTAATTAGNHGRAETFLHGVQIVEIDGVNLQFDLPRSSAERTSFLFMRSPPFF